MELILDVALFNSTLVTVPNNNQGDTHLFLLSSKLGHIQDVGEIIQPGGCDRRRALVRQQRVPWGRNSRRLRFAFSKHVAEYLLSGRIIRRGVYKLDAGCVSPESVGRCRVVVELCGC